MEHTLLSAIAINGVGAAATSSRIDNRAATRDGVAVNRQSDQSLPFPAVITTSASAAHGCDSRRPATDLQTHRVSATPETDILFKTALKKGMLPSNLLCPEYPLEDIVDDLQKIVEEEATQALKRLHGPICLVFAKIPHANSTLQMNMVAALGRRKPPAAEPWDNSKGPMPPSQANDDSPLENIVISVDISDSFMSGEQIRSLFKVFDVNYQQIVAIGAAALASDTEAPSISIVAASLVSPQSYNISSNINGPPSSEFTVNLVDYTQLSNYVLLAISRLKEMGEIIHVSLQNSVDILKSPEYLAEWDRNPEGALRRVYETTHLETKVMVFLRRMKRVLENLSGIHRSLQKEADLSIVKVVDLICLFFEELDQVHYDDEPRLRLAAGELEAAIRQKARPWADSVFMIACIAHNPRRKISFLSKFLGVPRVKILNTIETDMVQFWNGQPRFRQEFIAYLLDEYPCHGTSDAWSQEALYHRGTMLRPLFSAFDTLRRRNIGMEKILEAFQSGTCTCCQFDITPWGTDTRKFRGLPEMGRSFYWNETKES